MTDFFKNNPTTLRHCVLYVFLRKKSVGEAFNDFCEAVGNDVIKKEEFRHWFSQFRKGKFDDKEQPISDMRGIIRSDKQALRSCVMYEWLTTKNIDLVKRMKYLCRENEAFPVFAKYQNFCKAIGYGVMEYREFEFWFYRFFNGEHDLNFERDKDEKILELSDMPIDVMKYILEYLNTFNRMTEYLKNNPVALRHCLLYEYLQRNPYKRAFNNFRDTIGSDVFSEEELRSYFSQFRKRKMDGDDRRITDMRDVLRNDKYALRACILYESLKYKMAESGYKTCHLWPRSFLERPEIRRNPSFSLYNNFCKKLGDDVMEYREFDFWFYRFFNGEFDLNYEREKDKKIYELMDMPIDVMKNVVEYLDTFDRVSLIKTSRSVKTFVEDQKEFSKELKFGVDREAAWIYFKNRRIVITKNGDDCYRYSENKYTQNERLIKGVSHWKQVIQELESILKYPKLHLEQFSFSLFIPHNFNGPIKGELEELYKVTTVLKAAFKPIQQLHVKKLKLFTYNMNPLLNILPSMKPGYLSTIEISTHKRESNMMKEIVELEQWKQAKYLSMNPSDYEKGSYIGSLFHFYHFKEFRVVLKQLSVEDIRQIKNILFKSPGFEYCTIKVPTTFDMDTIKHEFGDLIQENTYHYPIPNSEDYFEIKIRDSNMYGIPILITRKQK